MTPPEAWNKKYIHFFMCFALFLDSTAWRKAKKMDRLRDAWIAFCAAHLVSTAAMFDKIHGEPYHQIGQPGTWIF